MKIKKDRMVHITIGFEFPNSLALISPFTAGLVFASIYKQTKNIKTSSKQIL
ncbi:MAG: hypothetical protein LBD23_11950 [Oscillospiraceae bacterium]|jgi:hypothetical protein|nr:hypothetical protein [Oscillospiraceae bacterium]